MKYAYISFGPIAKDTATIPLMIESIFNYYKKLKFGKIVIQPGWLSSNSSLILNEISKSFNQNIVIRSSAIGEDSIESSQAGKFESFLKKFQIDLFY